LTELYQQQKRWEDALHAVEELYSMDPNNVLTRLSLAELLLEVHPQDKATFKRVLRLSEEVENESALHAALLLYRARALRGLGLLTAARDTLTRALRRKKDRPQLLLTTLRYERALIYEALHQHARARAEFERVYMENPNFEDVATRLGV
jgi:tetratricopeptide (TPR) repeat protein